MASKIEEQAIALVDDERVAWEDEESFITERVSFNIRNLIRVCRKNYAGVFDRPFDRLTGRRKTWVPMTESVVEATVKNNDIDQKNIVIRAKKGGSENMATIVRGIITHALSKMYFNEKLDDMIRRLSIDGTAIWKTTWDSANDELSVTTVDPLNFYIDPTAQDPHKAYRVTERSLMTLSEIQAHSGWKNTDEMDLESDTDEQGNPNDPEASRASSGTSKMRDVWESYGKFPKSVRTGKKEDDKEEEEMHIVVSGIEVGNPRVHKIEKWDKVRPYEVAWYQRYPGRFFGRGVAEKLLMLQAWINLVVNTRITRHAVSQLGIFKVRRGSGITPQQISKLAANGAISVSNMGDIEQMAMQEASSSSYADEANIYSWAERVTAAFEVVTGEQLPSSTTATSVAIQSQSAQSQFVLIKKGIGNFLERWVKRQAMPRILKNLKKGDMLRITGDPEAMQAVFEENIASQVAKQLDEANKAGEIVDPEQVIEEVQRAFERFQDQGASIFFKKVKDMDPFEYDVMFDVGNQKVDYPVLAQQLMNALQIVPEARGVLLPKMFDALGLETIALQRELKKIEQQQQQQQQVEQAAQLSQGAPQVPQEGQVASNAATLANAPR